MVAYSLRTWRRNGIACDELIFLPGTPHGQRHGVEDPQSNNGLNTSILSSSSHSINNGGSNNNSPVSSRQIHNRSEGDVAAGVGFALQPDAGHAEIIEMVPHHSDLLRRSSPILNKRSVSFDERSSVSSVQEFANSWDEDSGDEGNETEQERLRRPLSVDLRQEDDDGSSGPVNRFRHNHPRISRIGSFFFFRSPTSSTYNESYAPSGPSVFGAALDLSMPILFNFHLFIEAYNHINSYGSETPAKILPLIFLSVLIVRSFIPPGRRGRFWGIMRYTVTAPFSRCLFRDAFIGDFLTSLVRPLQDVLFALSYYCTVIYGTLTGNYGLSASGRILESSWILHNLVLPAAALLPLWWKFLQTLRQSYDSGKRWPHYGNAAKYLSASIVILYGMANPEDRRSSWWLVCFGLCIVYQIWWDVFMDWELFVFVPRAEDGQERESSYCGLVSSYRPNSFFLPFHTYIIQPLKDAFHDFCLTFGCFPRMQMRPIRLYKSKAFYWRIFCYNAIFRFTWMLCFIPGYHLSRDNEYVTTFSSDTHSYVGVILPVIEILRRTFWGFLLLENETIKIQEGNPRFCRSQNSTDAGDLGETKDLLDESSKNRHLPSWLGPHNVLPPEQYSSSRNCFGSCSDETRRVLFILELSLWAVAFVLFGIWAIS